jgi:hypothetical protein
LSRSRGRGQISGVDETPREKWAGYFGLFVTVIPGMIMAGFMPAWDVLPTAGWVAVATAGAAIAGAIATPRTGRGALAGALTGAGLMLGIWLYVAIRGALTGHYTFLKVEIAIGALLGGTPGALLYARWARGAGDAKSSRHAGPAGSAAGRPR